MSDDEFAFAAPLRRTPPGPLERAYRRLAGRRFRRLREAAFFGVPGALVVVAVYELNVHSWLNDPLSLMFGLCGILCAGFGLLPPLDPPKGPPTTNPRSKRGRR